MDELYLAALSTLPNLGRLTILRLANLMGSSEAVYKAKKKELISTNLLTSQQVAMLLRERPEDLPVRLDYLTRKDGMRIISIFDQDYPLSFKQLHDPPLVLYVKGELPKENYRVAIVGSRNCTSYGVRATEEFAKALVSQGIPIISGGAKGIDSVAHEACLAAGGKTVAVMGCGLDVTYPYENKELFERIQENGAIISEFPPTTPPKGCNFPMRNRIIVGLSQAVIVAEAALASGASITANIAADEGRDVYCVPGNIFDDTSAGCNQLIRNGANLITSAEEILEDMERWRVARLRGMETSIFDFTPLDLEENNLQEENKSNKEEANCSEFGKELLNLLKRGTMSLEALTQKSGRDVPTVSMELLDLQVAGLVKQDIIGNYCRA